MQTLNKLSKKFRRSAVPEYIWYISLIIIAITLVVGIVNITKKANKNINPPSNLNVQFDVTIDPNNIVRIKTLDFIGSFDLEKDTLNLYLCCGNSCKNLMELFLAEKPRDLFARKVSGAIGLEEMNGLILGKNGKAMLFDGKSYIEIPWSNDFKMNNNEVTLMVIIKPLPKINNKFEDIIGRNQGCWEQEDYSLSADNYKAFRSNLGSEDSNECSKNPEGYYKIDRINIYEKDINRDFYNLYHILIGSAAKNEMKFLVDGKLFKKSRDLMIVPDLIAYTTLMKYPIYIGTIGPSYTDTYGFNGTIDEIRIYNRALSDEEIKQCFLGNCLNDNSLVLYLDFEDCTAKDKSGHGNDGTIHGNVTCIDEGILSGVQLYYPRQCFDKGVIWQLYYGNPDEGGVLIAQDKVDRKWSLS